MGSCQTYFIEENNEENNGGINSVNDGRKARLGGYPHIIYRNISKREWSSSFFNLFKYL